MKARLLIKALLVLGTPVLAVGLLLLGNALFFTQMFWLHRYALPCHPGLLVVACGILFHPRWRQDNCGGPISLGLRSLPVAAAAIWSVVGLHAPTPPDEAELNFSYADVIATHRQVFSAMEELQLGDEARALTAWPMTVELEQPYLGYVKRPIPAKHIDNLPPDPALEDYRFRAVLAPMRSRHTQGLREAAQRLQFTKSTTYQVGNAQALELWTP